MAGLSVAAARVKCICVLCGSNDAWTKVVMFWRTGEFVSFVRPIRKVARQKDDFGCYFPDLNAVKVNIRLHKTIPIRCFYE